MFLFQKISSGYILSLEKYDVHVKVFFYISTCYCRLRYIQKNNLNDWRVICKDENTEFLYPSILLEKVCPKIFRLNERKFSLKKYWFEKMRKCYPGMCVSLKFNHDFHQNFLTQNLAYNFETNEPGNAVELHFRFFIYSGFVLILLKNNDFINTSIWKKKYTKNL